MALLYELTYEYLLKKNFKFQFYNRSAILTVDKTVITRNQRIGVSHEGHHTWNLHIRDVQRTDAGAYMCQINTAKAKTRMGHLTVVGK